MLVDLKRRLSPVDTQRMDGQRPGLPPALVRLVVERWHLDLTDDEDLLRLRGRVVAVVLGAGLAAAVLNTPAALASGAGATVLAGTTAAVAGVFALAFVYGHRLNDVGFGGLVLLGMVLSAAGAGTQPGSTASRIGLSLITPMLLGAIFTRSPAVLAVELGFGTALLAGTHLVLDVPGATTDVPLAAFNLVAVGATTHLLWRLALRSLRRARLGEVTDPLTGVANRRGLERLGGRRWVGSARSGLPVAVLVIDVDHFKRVNDTLGHAAGDDVLRRLGDLLSDAVRAHDVVARLGGEEFVVLCGLPPGEGACLAERLRVLVAEQLAPITVSIGIHETRPSEDNGLEALWSAVERADAALYRAKQAGRNRVETTDAPAG